MRFFRPAALAVAFVASGVLAACVSKKDKTSPAPPASASAAAADPVAAFLADKSQPLTPEIEEKLLLALKSCKVDDNGIQPRCPEYRNFNQARVRKWKAADPAAEGAAIGLKHLGDESPAVRLMSARMMGAKTGSSPATRKALLAAADKEKVAGVLVSMLRALGPHQQGDAGIGKLLMKSADSPSQRVRMEAMGWLLTPAGAAIDGSFKKISDALAKDPSAQVRTYLCSRLYGSGNADAIPLLQKYLLAKDTPPQMMGGCFQGLVGAWTGYPRPKKPSKEAYELTLKVLKATPRTEQRPPWTGISSLRAARTDIRPGDAGGKKWLDNVKGWYKQQDLLAALESVAGDLDANWLARSSALDVMRQLGAPKADYKRVLAHYAKATGRDLSVKNRIQALIDQKPSTAMASGALHRPRQASDVAGKPRLPAAPSMPGKPAK